MIQALAAGFFSAGLRGEQALAADILGRSPAKLPDGQSIYRLSGTVLVNGVPATMQTRIGGGDTVETGKNSEIVFVVGDSSFILRGESRVVLEAPQQNSAVLSGLRLLTGALLSVFKPGRPVRMGTIVATIGIRGTGVYMETDPEQTYFCTCYGTAEITSNNDPNSREVVQSKHHDRPLYIAAKPGSGGSIRSAPFINHTDQELTLIETLVGRVPPFVFPGDSYKTPRRSDTY